MTAKIDGTTGIEFPDSTVQGSAAIVDGPAFSAKLTGSPQSVSVNTYVKALLDTENFDTANAYSSSRFTPQVAGYYQVNGAVYCGGSGISSSEAAIYKNGAFVAGASIASSSPQVPAVSDIVYLNGTTDYVELYGYVGATSGGNFDVEYTRMSAALIRSA